MACQNPFLQIAVAGNDDSGQCFHGLGGRLQALEVIGNCQFIRQTRVED